MVVKPRLTNAEATHKARAVPTTEGPLLAKAAGFERVLCRLDAARMPWNEMATKESTYF